MTELFSGNMIASGVLHVIVQVSLVLGIVLLTLRWQRRKGAAVRHTICAWGLAAAVLCPLATWLIWSQGVTGIRISPPAPAPAEAQAPAAPGTTIPGSLDQSPSDDTSATVPALNEFVAAQGEATEATPVAVTQPNAPSGWKFSFKLEWLRVALTIFVGVWVAGLLFGFVRLIHGFIYQRRLLHKLRPVTLFAHPGLGKEVCEALGTSVLPRLAISPGVRSPVCVGLFHPMVLLPEGLVESLTSTELRAILIHEAAHVMRRDLWVGLLQRIATMVLWMHPWAHVISRELSQSREEICDNYVLRHENKIVYARMLLTLSEDPAVRHGAPATVGLAPSRWGLEDRVNGILDRARNLMTRTRTAVRVALGISFIGLTLVVSSASVRAADEEPAAVEPSSGKPDDDVADTTGTPDETKAPARKPTARSLPRRVFPGPHWTLSPWGGTGTLNAEERRGVCLQVADPKAGKMALAMPLKGADLSRYKTVQLTVELGKEKPFPVLASFAFQVGEDFHWIEAPPKMLKQGSNKLTFKLWTPEWKCKASGWHHRTTPQGKGPAHHANLVFHGLDREDEVTISSFRLVRGEAPSTIPADAAIGPTEVPELLTPQQHDSPDVTRAGILRVHVLNLLQVYAADLKALGRDTESKKITGVVRRALKAPLAAPSGNPAKEGAGQ